MIKMKLVEDKKLYISYPPVGLVRQGDEVEIYKKHQKEFEALGFELVAENKDEGGDE